VGPGVDPITPASILGKKKGEGGENGGNADLFRWLLLARSKKEKRKKGKKRGGGRHKHSYANTAARTGGCWKKRGKEGNGGESGGGPRYFIRVLLLPENRKEKRKRGKGRTATGTLEWQEIITLPSHEEKVKGGGRKG